MTEPAAATDPRDDHALMAAHVAGDPEAFGELVRRHRDRLWAVALRTTSDPEDASDALQDALIAFQKTYESKPVAFKKWDGYKKLLADGDKALADGKLKAALGPIAKVDADAKKLTPGLLELVKSKLAAVNEKAVAQLTEIKDGTLDDAAKLKAARALRAEVSAKFSSGNLPVLAELDAWLKETAAAAAPAK